MELKWIKNHNLFPFINGVLLQEVLDFAAQKRVTMLKFSKQYNLEYIGELAERWHERDIVQSKQDLIALILAIQHCTSGTFLYDQRKLFIKSICDHLKANWSATAASVILSYGRDELETVPELLEIQDMFGQFSDSFDCESERILLISILSNYYAIQKPNHALKNYILRLIDEMRLSLSNIHNEYPLLLILSEVYPKLGKPTAKEFKSKGMSKFLQVITSLRTKELVQDNYYPASQVLGVNHDDIPVLNYYLAYENVPSDHSITGPGFSRIKENFISCHFLSDKDVPPQVVKIVDDMVESHEREDKKQYSHSLNHPLRFILSRIKEKQFPNRDNLKLLIEKLKQMFLYDLDESHIFLIEEEIVEGKQREEIIERLLTRCRLKKEHFDFLEKQRVLFGVDINVTSSYSVMCLEYGYISMYQIEELEKRGMLNFIIQHLMKTEAYEDFVDLLERVPYGYHQFLAEETTFNQLKSKMDDGLKKRLYPIYLNALYNYKASKYPERVFDMLKNAEFIYLFALSEHDIQEIERRLSISKLLSESQIKSIQQKYMTPEELEELKIQDLCKELQGSSRYGLSSFAGKHWGKMLENNTLRETFVEKLLTIETKSEYDVGGFLLMFYQLRAENVLDQEQIERIESAALQKAKKIKIA